MFKVLILLCAIAGPTMAVAQILIPSSPAIPHVTAAEVQWADVDGDSDPDLLIAGTDSLGQAFTDLLRNDDTVFTPLNSGLTPRTHAVAAWADIDGDQDLDLFLSGQTGHQQGLGQIFLNDSSGGLTPLALDLPDIVTGAALWGDFDRDGDQDLFANGFDFQNVAVSFFLRNDSGGAFTTLYDTSFVGLEWARCDTADENGDGNLDIILTGFKAGADEPRELVIFHNQGNFSFARSATNLPAVEIGSIDWADVDGDLDQDILVSGYSGVSNLGVYLNVGGTYQKANINMPDLALSDARWGDFDKDGDPDILCSGQSGTTTTGFIFRNDGNLQFVDHQPASPIVGLQFARLAWADRNGDGFLDFVITGETAEHRPRSYIYTYSTTNFRFQ